MSDIAQLSHVILTLRVQCETATKLSPHNDNKIFALNCKMTPTPFNVDEVCCSASVHFVSIQEFSHRYILLNRPTAIKFYLDHSVCYDCHNGILCIACLLF